MSGKKKDDEKMNATVQKAKVERKKSVRESFRKALKANGKALEKLSKN